MDILIRILSNPKNLVIFILIIFLLILSGYYVYKKFKIVNMNTTIVKLEGNIKVLNMELKGVSSNLDTCNKNVENIKDYNTKINIIGKNTDDIRKKINELKQPINTTIIQPSTPTSIESLKPPVASGGTDEKPSKEDVEIIDTANSIIRMFNITK